MIRVLMMLVVLLWGYVLAAEKPQFYDLRSCGTLLYNVLASYVQEHHGANYNDIRTYLRSGEVSTIFDIGDKSCFNRFQVVQAAYQLSLSADPSVQSIQQGLHDEVQGMIFWRKVQKYTVYGCGGLEAVNFVLVVYVLYRHRRARRDFINPFE